MSRVLGLPGAAEKRAIKYELAVAFCRALGLDPWEAGGETSNGSTTGLLVAISPSIGGCGRSLAGPAQVERQPG